MVWVQIPSREEQKFDRSKIYNSNTVWFNFQTYIYAYIYILHCGILQFCSSNEIILICDVHRIFVVGLDPITIGMYGIFDSVWFFAVVS